MDAMEMEKQQAGGNEGGQEKTEAEDKTAVSLAGTEEGKGAIAGQDNRPAMGEELKKLREELEAEKEEAVKNAVEEAMKKASMKPEEVKEYEGRKREEELEKRERDLQLRELKNDTKDILHEKGIPACFTEFLIGADLETTKVNIDAFKKEFDLAVQAQVEQRMKGTTPKAGSGAGSGGLAAEIGKYL